MVRDLTTCEEIHTRISHKTVDSVLMIVGSYVGGFLVADLEYKMPFPVQLPFKNIKDWNVI